MIKIHLPSKGFIFAVLLGTGFLFSECVFAITPTPNISPSSLPGSILPERASSNLTPAPVSNPQTLPPLHPQKNQAPNTLGAEASKIKFKLTRINLQGEHVYTKAQLAELYQKKLNTMITVEQLQGIVQDITNFYRNNGYILSRAILPPQHVADGVVYIQVVEGYVDHVKVIGVPKGAKRLLEGYGRKIANNRPLQIKVMEHYLLLANEVPGVEVKAVLEPSKTNLGASILNMVTETKTASAYLSYDNYGTRYIGPLQVSAGAELHSMFRSGDSTQFSAVRTTRPQELRYMALAHNTPLGTNGMRLLVSANQALTRPGFVLAPLLLDGDSETVSATVQYPMIRSRTHNLTLDGAFNYIDSSVAITQQTILLYSDHLRTMRLGGSFDISDKWNGSNSVVAHVEQGLEFLGATPTSQANTGTTSRVGGSGHFTKMDMQLSRLQQFGTSRYSAFLQVTGQYALEPLLASEQFGFGGAQQGLGRGYDPAEIIGDRGLAGSFELRMNVSPEKALLQAVQFFAFYDAGVIWNARNIINQAQKQSATSTGLGARMYFTKNFSGNFLFAQPLTKQVSALQFIGNGRSPRVFFSLTASV